jgi:1-acyl-sn-glycerol-3-phosphate acyltransferase
MLQTTRRYGLMLIVRPIARLLFGLDVIGKEKLPQAGPAIVAANHNSHVDTIVLLCLFPSKLLPKLRPVAAADHFDKGGFGSWFSRNIIGNIPITRGASRSEVVLAGAKEALARGEILVVFPEGSRGAPEEMTRFKTGEARLVEACPQATVTPVYLQGAGRSRPKDA